MRIVLLLVAAALVVSAPLSSSRGDVSVPERPSPQSLRLDRCLVALSQARDEMAREEPRWNATVTRQYEGVELRHAAADGLFRATVRPSEHDPTDWSFVRDDCSAVAIRYYDDDMQGRIVVQDATRPGAASRFIHRVTAALDACLAAPSSR